MQALLKGVRMPSSFGLRFDNYLFLRDLYNSSLLIPLLMGKRNVSALERCNFRELIRRISMKDLIDRVISNPSARRKFLKGVGVTGLGVAAASMLGSSLVEAEAQPQISDVAIINFALNLEYLEAEFYSVATTGKTLQELGLLSSSDVTGPTTGGQKVNMNNDKIAWLGTALASDEQTHVAFLRTVLGSAAVKKPAINLNALGYGFRDVAQFLKLSRQFEDVGVSAYLGAAPLIKSKAYLAAAAEILSTEAQHSGAIRIKCIDNGVVSPAVDSLDVPPTPQTPFDVDSNALSIQRTPSQVPKIVYGGGTCSCGFSPDGMNGTIVCQS